MLFLFGVISLLASALAGWILHDRLSEEYVSKGRAIARSIVNSSVETLLNRDAATIQSMIDEYLEIQGIAYVFVEDAQGRIVSHTFVPAVPPEVSNLPSDPRGMHVERVWLSGVGEVLDVAKPILAGVAGYVHVGMDMQIIRDTIWSAILKFQLLVFVIFVGSVVLLYAVVNAISRPLTELTEYARKLAARDFTAEVEIVSNDEIGLLANTMRTMAHDMGGLFADLEQAVSRATGEMEGALAYLTTIIDNLADGLLVTDVTGRIALTNPALRRLFGLGGGEFAGLRVSGVFRGQLAELAEQARRSAPSEVCRAEIPLPGGRVGTAIGTAVARRGGADGAGAMSLGAVVLVRDITHEKELDRLKTDFISTVSHELRTPMTSILGFAQIIRKRLARTIAPELDGREPAVDRAVRQVGENLEIIVTEARRLTELINDVLDIAKMESGKVEWRENEVDVVGVVRHSVAAVRGLVEDKGLVIQCEVSEGLPVVPGDFDRLVQVMVNLLSNAVKFTEKSPITVRAERRGDVILVSVNDRGCGIPDKDQETVFEKFKQSGSTLTGKPRGTGLGLPICKQIVTHHGGWIWAESQEGVGSTFFFTLPLERRLSEARDRDEPAAPGREEPGEEPLILVVDDDPAVRRYLHQIFEEEGYRTASAKNGHEAVAVARARRPDCITMDLIMPLMDGRTAIKLLRADPLTRDIPVMVVSVLGEEADATGADAVMTKPVDGPELVAGVANLLRRRRGMV
jgi:PAS domain S-box-containing protein